LKAQLKYLRVAAGTLAATWFALRGCAVSLPIEYIVGNAGGLLLTIAEAGDPATHVSA
jgi:hypothetical protein